MLLYSAEQIAEQMKRVARAAEAFHPDIAIAIPTASFMFAADLMRLLPGTLPFHQFGFIGYGGIVGKLGAPNVRKLVEGKRVLIIDSCFDSGDTLEKMAGTLVELCNAACTWGVVAVNKGQREYAPLDDNPCDDALFYFPPGVAKENPFLYGYGMDRKDGTGRGLPYIAVEETKRDIMYVASVDLVPRKKENE